MTSAHICEYHSKLIIKKGNNMFEFITEDRYAIATENQFVIKNKKNEIEKTYPGGHGCDLFRIKNSRLFAYVKESNFSPLVRRFIPPTGPTVLIDAESLEEKAKIEVPLQRGSYQLNNGLIIGMYGSCILIFDPATQRQIPTQVFRYHLKGVEPILDNSFALLTYAGASIFSTTLEPFDYEWCVNVDNTLRFVALPENQFLQQVKTGPQSFALQRCELTETYRVDIVKNQNYHWNIHFKEWLLLPDEKTVLGISMKNIIYLIDSQNLQIEKLKLQTTSPIESFILTKHANLFAILKDETVIDMASCFDAQKTIATQIYENCTYPKVLAEMISQYTTPCLFKKILPNTKITKDVKHGCSHTH
jgi:hypothetical protein